MSEIAWLEQLPKSLRILYAMPVMGMKELRWLFVATLAVGLGLSSSSDPLTIGVSQEWINGKYRFAGGTSPVALGFALMVGALYLLLMFAPPPRVGEPLPGVFRRFLTFFLDFILAMILITPVIGTLPTLTEWKRTGAFEWHFDRTVYASGDGWLTAAMFILIIPGMVFYFAFPLTRSRPSPGACITGYQVVPDEETRITVRTAILRTLLGFIAACGACAAPFVARDPKKGKFWLDEIFGTRALKLL